MTEIRKNMRVLVCPNAFKGSLTGMEAAQAIGRGIARANTSDQSDGAAEDLRLSFDIELLPLADGGDGTLETLTAGGGSAHAAWVTGPMGEPVEAVWGRLGGIRSHTAIIEMAKASGLTIAARSGRLDPMNSTTYGTGELMLAAVEAGCTVLLVGIGGSATNDGGAGMAAALGASLLDKDGNTIPPGGAGLELIESIEMSHWKLPANVQVRVACDVDNPLIGSRGAAHVFGPQKGADPEMVLRLDAALGRFGELMESTFAKDLLLVAGAGAAGGLGAGLMAFCGGSLMPGTDMIMDAVGFSERLDACDIVVTGEGRLDDQTAHGKVIGVVSRRAHNAGKPCIALCGGIDPEGYDALRKAGLTAAFCIADGPISLEYAMQNGATLLERTAEQVAQLIGTV